MPDQKRTHGDADTTRTNERKHTEETVHEQDELVQETFDPYGAYQRAVSARSASIQASDILALQQTAGNSAVQRLMANIIRQQSAVQAKLTVNPPGDQYEQEADRIAEQVMSMPPTVDSQTSASVTPPVQRQEEEEEEIQAKPLSTSMTPPVQRQEEEEEVQAMPLSTSMTPPVQRQEEEEEVQAMPLSTSMTPPVQRQEEEEEVQAMPQSASMTPHVQRQEEGEEEEEALQPKKESDGRFAAGRDIEGRISASRGSGESLSGTVREPMERAFGADFSRVRVHSDSEADALSEQLNAKAFTTGTDIFFKRGAYDPDSGSGRGLLAHELTHVVQQGMDRVSRDVSGVTIRTDGNSRVAMQADRVIQMVPVDGAKLLEEAKKSATAEKTIKDIEKKTKKTVEILESSRGSYTSGEKIYIDKGKTFKAQVNSLSHEINHLHDNVYGRKAEVATQTRAEYIKTRMDNEIKAQYKTYVAYEERGSGDKPLGYDGYKAKLEEAAKAKSTTIGKLKAAEREKIANEYLADQYKNVWTTSNTGQNYYEYWGSHWDRMHPSP